MESELSEVASITLSSQGSLMTYDEMADYLLSNNNYLYVDDKAIMVDEIYVDVTDNSDAIYITIYFYDGLNDFIDIFTNNRNELTQAIFDISAVVSDYYGNDTTATLVYSNPYTYYPSEFESNKLYSDSISYYEDFWFVWYPYVSVELDYINRTYVTDWAY